MRSYPALAITWLSPPAEAEVERLLALIDDDGPTALDGDGRERRIFFASTHDRDRAGVRLVGETPPITVRPVDVADDDWAERSQAALRPVTVGRIVVTPPWHADEVQRADRAGRLPILIRPSMGFGTGHHASTRLCLRLLQTLRLDGRAAVDVGTGSGVLALAAWRLGAAPVDGLDPDADALDSARDNLALNGATGRVRLHRGTLDSAAAGRDRYDVILANLTGDLLCRSADALTRLARPEAFLTASGFETDESDRVVAALTAHGWTLVSAADEDGWCGTVLQALPTSPTAPTAS